MTGINLIDDVASPKLPMKLEGRSVVGPGGFNGRIECSKKNRYAIDLNSRDVHVFSSPMRCNSFKSSLIVFVQSSISLILRLSRFPHVLFSAIKTVSVDMVHLIGRESHDKSVKGYHRTSISTLRDRGQSIRIWSVFRDMPLKSAYDIRVVIVDHCRLALSEFNFNHIKIVPIFSVTETTPTGIKIVVKEA